VTRVAPTVSPTLGLRANLAQFSLLVAVNALVGGMLGQERTVLPLLAEQAFHLSAYTAALTYIVAFGATKAVTNFVAGTLSDRYGRKPVLVAGWLIALPVPLLLIWAPAWGWVIFANVLLGINQGLTWSTTVIMKIDLVGPTRRGLAMGLNEASGYLALAGTAMATGAIAAPPAVPARRRLRRARPRSIQPGCTRDPRARPHRSHPSRARPRPEHESDRLAHQRR
jgi:MFS family permease